MQSDVPLVLCAVVMLHVQSAKRQQRPWPLWLQGPLRKRGGKFKVPTLPTLGATRDPKGPGLRAMSGICPPSIQESAERVLC